MTFLSILFERTVANTEKETPEAPVFFVDLNLDQVIDAITAGFQEYDPNIDIGKLNQDLYSEYDK